jgi:hypothetical protein
MEPNKQKGLDLGKHYLSQGMAKAHIPTNDCGPTSVAMMINLIQEKSGIRNKKISKKEVASVISFLGRIPKWIPRVGGASTPWGLVSAFNTLAHRNQIPWEAHRASHAEPSLIRRTLAKKGYLSILRVWKNGGAHWSNVVHFDKRKGKIQILDPNPYLSHLPASKIIQSEDWKTVQQDWERQPWWAKIFRIKRELIIYQRTDN